MTHAYLYPNRATLSFGPAVEFDRTSTTREALEAATHAIREAVAHLKAQQHSAR